LQGIARFVLETAAVFITMGGLFDVFVPRLPSHLIALCGQDEKGCRLARELLRALGGSLVAIGISLCFLVASPSALSHRVNLVLVLLLVLPSEGINSFCMRRVGSPFYIPLAFAMLTLLGVLLALPNSSQ
jgi:hypothetical protein